MSIQQVGKFTKKDLQRAVDNDNAHRYRGVTCGLVALSDLKKVARLPVWDYSLPTFKPWRVATHGFNRYWSDPDWKFSNQVDAAHGAAGDYLLKHIFMKDGAGVVLAGGKVSLAMQMAPDATRSNEGFYDFQRSDFDLFIVGMSEADAEKEILSILEDMKACKFDNVTCYRNQNCVTIMCEQEDGQPMIIQIILRLYSSISEIIHGFDVGAAQVAYDGKEIWLTSLGRVAYEQGIIVLNLSRRRGTYESRLAKYFHRGFSVVLPNLKMSELKKHQGFDLPFIQLRPTTINGYDIEGYIYEQPGTYSDYGGCDYLPKEVALANFRKLMLSTDEKLKDLFLFYKVGENLGQIEAPLPTLEELREYYGNSVLNKLDTGDMSPRHLSKFMPDAFFKSHAHNLMGRFLTGYGPTPADYWDSMQLTDRLLDHTEKRKATHFELQDHLKPQWKAVEEGTTLKEDQKMINPFKMEVVSVEEWYGDFYAENA